MSTRRGWQKGHQRLPWQVTKPTEESADVPPFCHCLLYAQPGSDASPEWWVMSRFDRQQQAQQREQAAALQAKGLSGRAIAEVLGIAHTTLHYRQQSTAVTSDRLPVAMAEQLGQAAMLPWLQRLFQVALFVITQRAGGGVRQVQEFLELSGLSSLIASSTGYLQTEKVALEQAINEVAQRFTEPLGSPLAATAVEPSPRPIALACDEHFHGGICLVAMEPHSGFIFGERYTADRTVSTWQQQVKAWLQPFALSLQQGVSDEAVALKSLYTQHQAVPHLPDLFHIQQDIGKALSTPLRQRLRQAERVLAERMAALVEEQGAARAWWRRLPKPGRPPNFTARLMRCIDAKIDAAMAVEEAKSQRQRLQQLRAELSTIWQPIDRVTGDYRSAAACAQALRSIAEQLFDLADEIDLSDKRRRRLNRFPKKIERMAAALDFVATEREKLWASYRLTNTEQQLLQQSLYPGYFLQRIAKQARRAPERHLLRQRAQQLLASMESDFDSLPQTRQALLIQLAKRAAALFQRSSSAVEGRNSQLARYHHNHHRMAPRTLQAQTALHNFYHRQADGTTAAERLFGRRHDSLFETVLQQLPLPAAPRRRRPNKIAPYPDAANDSIRRVA